MFWPRITQDITNEVQSCNTCQVYLKSQPRETLQQHEIPAQPWTKIGADLFELQGKHYLLVADYYSVMLYNIILNNTNVMLNNIILNNCVMWNNTRQQLQQPTVPSLSHVLSLNAA